jgi:hypothetical protein
MRWQRIMGSPEMRVDTGPESLLDHRLNFSNTRSCSPQKVVGTQQGTELSPDVANFLEQQGTIPLTNMLALGAMGKGIAGT